MHLVTAIVKAHRVESVSDALKDAGATGMTIGDVQGYRPPTGTHRGVPRL